MISLNYDLLSVNDNKLNNNKWYFYWLMQLFRHFLSKNILDIRK